MSNSKRGRTGILSAGAALVLAATGTLAATTLPATAAGPGSGVCKVKDDPQWNGWTSHAEVTAELKRLEQTSKGRITVEQRGTTKQGRELWSARVGEGDKVLLVTTAIHGNERTGTEALLGLLGKLAAGGTPEARQILSEVTLVAMPMVNPDGGELNRRINVVPWADVVQDFPQLEGAPRAWYHSLRGDGIELPGFDLNRDFNPDLDYVVDPADLPGRQTDAGFFLSPESRAIRDTYVGLQQEFGKVDAYVDLHHMGPCNRLTGGEQDGKLVSVTLDYPPLGVNDGAKYKAQYPALDQDKSRRYALAVANGILEARGSQSPLAAVGRYLHPDAREYAGQGRSALAMQGTGTVLFEVRGQQDDIGQKQKGMLTRTVQTGITALATALAGGRTERVDGDDFFDLPDYGWDTASD
jgi:hypothetical protein